MSERNTKIVAMVSQGMSYSQVANHLGVTRGAVAGAVDRHRKKGMGPGPSRGEHHRMAKLTDEKVRAMRLLKVEGEKVSYIAAMFGVDIGAASRAINGKTWSHVK